MTEQPFHLSTMAPARRRTGLWVAVAAVVVVVIGVSVGAYLLGSREQNTAAPATATSSVPSSAAASLAPSPADEELVCAAAVPVLSRSADLVKAAAKETSLPAKGEAGTEKYRTELRGTIASVTTIVGMSPESLRSDMEIQLRTLKRVETWLDQGGTLRLEEFVVSGIRIAGRCALYTK